MTVSPCVWEKLEVTLLRFSINRWLGEFPTRVKLTLQWVAFGTVTLSVLLLIISVGAWVLDLAWGHMMAVIGSCAIGFSAAVLVGHLAVTKIIDNASLTIEGRANIWLSEMRMVTHADSNLLVLQELSRAINAGDIARQAQLTSEASPELARTLLFRMLQRNAAELERSLQRLRPL